ncbi:HpcH/HpaI aldolase family protein [Phenylobacterium immobile]|uniref:HpcH/HpaI aldolase family protein n=1 Tax=Phenylobacterium immobile TaxID=21 RepID=UPI000ACA2D80|nr:HpcH/HpaI aldolase/citrate lyase family protein [Phenylobacterium immobile]
MSDFTDLIAQSSPLVGLWQALATPYTAEICAGAGYDWLLFDGEHAPNTLQTLVGQLQAISRHPVHPVARPPSDDPAVIKQYLDIGFPTLLVPMVDDAVQAARIVASTRFPPEGFRGVASATSRASGFGAEPGYLAAQRNRVGVIVQIESLAGLDSVEAIAAVPGVDALFIGPGDLSAAMGHLGNPRHPDVQAAIDDAFGKIKAAGKPAGIFALDAEDARKRFAQGFSFASVGTDIGVLASSVRALRAGFKTET